MATIYITTDQGLKNIITGSLNYLKPILDEKQYEDFKKIFQELILKNKRDNAYEERKIIDSLAEEARILKEHLNSLSMKLICDEVEINENDFDVETTMKASHGGCSYRL